jgi:hypothetical protein
VVLAPVAVLLLPLPGLFNACTSGKASQCSHAPQALVSSANLLLPQATRPLALVAHKAVSHVGPEGEALPDAQSQNRLVNKRGQAAGEWDVSKMAPKLREE